MLHRRACQISLLLCLSITLGVAFLGDWIWKIWTVGKVPTDPVLLNIMLLQMVVSAFWFTSSVVPMAINQHQRMARAMLTATCLALVLAWVLMHVPSLGLRGAAIAWWRGICLRRFMCCGRACGCWMTTWVSLPAACWIYRCCSGFGEGISCRLGVRSREGLKGFPLSLEPKVRFTGGAVDRGLVCFCSPARVDVATLWLHHGCPWSIGCGDPRSQMRDLGHPSRVSGWRIAGWCCGVPFACLQRLRGAWLGSPLLCLRGASAFRVFRRIRGRPRRRPGSLFWNGFRRRMAC